jgi:transcription initiation factor TFIID subunit 9B
MADAVNEAQPNGNTASPAAGGNLPTPPPAPLSVPTQPLTSNLDSGAAKRPRDARLIHLLLSSLGVSAYQERVPLQLLDFAYRHTSSILSDALHLSSDAYISQQTRARDAPPGGGLRDADGQVSMSAVQLAIQSRLQYQFNGGNSGGLSKEFLLETAEQRNKIRLPNVNQPEWGVRLPNEKFVLTGVPWGLKDQWETETEAEEPEGDGDVVMENAEEAAEEVEGGTAEDLFGENFEDDVMAEE